MKQQLLGCVAGFCFVANVFGETTGPVANPYAAYPPSCLADPLPTVPTGPVFSGRVNLSSAPSVSPDYATLILWRSPCSQTRAALLGELMRDGAALAIAPAPVYPNVFASQGSVANVGVRLAPEPNTVRSSLFGQSPQELINVFVFENFSVAGHAQIDFSAELAIKAVAVDGSETSIHVPAYSAADYPEAALSLPISGFMTGNWYDPAHPGEGAQVEVIEMSPSGRILTFAWYTFDLSGQPFWLFGQGEFEAGDRVVSVAMDYAIGGTFAGNEFTGFPNGAVTMHWGLVSVEFPDCNTMRFTYQGGLELGIPQGAGERSWTRLTGINGLRCQ